MQTDQQVPFLISHPGQTHPPQGGPVQRKRPRHEVQGVGPERRLQITGLTQVHPLDLHRRRRFDHLQRHRFSFRRGNKAGAQGLVTLGQPVQGPLQGPLIEPAGQAQDPRQVIG